MQYYENSRYQPDQRQPRYKHNTMTVEGKGTVAAIPDQAIITIGIISEAVNVVDAQAHNSSISTKVIEAIKKAGIPAESIRTAHYSVQPIYQYTEGKTVLKDYEVRHLLEIQISDLTKIGMILNIATENGANQVQDVTFQVSKPDIVYRQSLQLAIIDAIGKAKEMSKTLHVHLNQIPIKIEEENPHHYEPKRMEKMVLSSTSESVPVQPGELKVTASIKAVFSYIN